MATLISRQDHRAMSTPLTKRFDVKLSFKYARTDTREIGRSLTWLLLDRSRVVHIERIESNDRHNTGAGAGQY